MEISFLLLEQDFYVLNGNIFFQFNQHFIIFSDRDYRPNLDEVRIL